MQDYNEFHKSLEFTLKWEGNYSNDPDDPGGETKWGIAKRSHPDVDIANLTPEDAAAIYALEYWDACGCDDIPFPLNCVVFDTAVNCGVRRAMSWLRDNETPAEFIDARVQHYTNLVNKNPAMGKYLRGWMNRINDLKKFVEINSPN